MTPKKFIEQVLIKDIEKIKSKVSPYLSAALISIGIEFLGKCIDDSINNWNEGSSKTLFNLAIEKLMPKEYERHNLYKSLRCGFAHQLAPQNGLSLSENAPNLSSIDGKTVLNINTFYDDFIKACEQVIKDIDDKKFTEKEGKNMYGPFIYKIRLI